MSNHPPSQTSKDFGRPICSGHLFELIFTMKVLVIGLNRGRLNVLFDLCSDRWKK